MRWFGESWGAPVCEPENEVPIPLGWICESCGVAFAEGDRGVTLVYYDEEGRRDFPLHLDCLLDSVGPTI